MDCSDRVENEVPEKNKGYKKENELRGIKNHEFARPNHEVISIK